MARLAFQHARLDKDESVATRAPPPLGEVRALPNGWCQSPWLGAFDAAPFPFIRYLLLGLLPCDPKPGETLWLHSARWGWLGTTPAMFPDCWLMQADGRVIRLRLRLDDTLPPRWLDPRTGAEIGPF